MNDLKSLNLTEKDFDLLVDGLDNLPSKNLAGDLMFDLLTMGMTKDDPEARDAAKKEREIQNKKKQREMELMKEDVRILQGKLLMLKRYLIENDLLNQAKEQLG